MPVTIVIRTDERRAKKHDKFPVKMWITHERVSIPYQTIYDLSREDFEKFSSPNVGKVLKAIRDDLKALEEDAATFIKGLDPFNFIEFEKLFVRRNPRFRKRKKFSKTIDIATAALQVTDQEFDFTPYLKRFPLLGNASSTEDSLSFLYCSYIKQLIMEKSIGNASSCHCSYVSLSKFNGDVKISQVTVTYLKQYEAWMKLRSKSQTTVGIYLRALRTIFNEAVASNVISDNRYPFGRRKYIIPTGSNVKKAIDLNWISEMFNYEPTHEKEAIAKDFWFFCYLGNGMNPKDMVNLKEKNIRNELIVFERSKTQRTARKESPTITFFLTEELKVIIGRRGNKGRKKDDYIFPILEAGLTPLEEFTRVQQFIKFMNLWMGKIAQKLGMPQKPLAMEARHSFATIMRDSGARTEFIQEALGHKDSKTTQAYLDSFPLDVKKQFAKRLLPGKE